MVDPGVLGGLDLGVPGGVDIPPVLAPGDRAEDAPGDLKYRVQYSLLTKLIEAIKCENHTHMLAKMVRHGFLPKVWFFGCNKKKRFGLKVPWLI